MNDVSKEAFGRDSVFDRMYECNAKILFYHVGFDKCTFVHYVEQALNVDYRFKKYFTGEVTRDGKTWIDTFSFFARYLDRNVETDFSKLERMLHINWVNDCAVISCQDIFDKTRELILKEPYGLLLQEPEEIVDGLPANIKDISMPYKHIKDIVETIYPMQRTLNSPDVIVAMRTIGSFLPDFSIYYYKPTTKKMTWRVPEGWEATATLKCNGNVICEYPKQPLSLVAYSTSIQKKMPYEELAPHLYTAKGATPWIFKYYERDWGFCMPKEVADNLSRDGEYEVDIDAQFDENLPLPVMVSPSLETDKGHLYLISHIDHPYQANDGISGLAVEVEVMRRLREKPLPESASYDVRMLVTPETIGSVCYFSEGRHNAVGAIFADAVGNNKINRLVVQGSRKCDTELDKACRYLYPLLPFRSALGNDEIITNGAGLDIPTVSFTRAPYPEYHTDKDTPDIIFEDSLQETADRIEEVVRIFCTNYIPVAKFTGAPFLSGYDLWVDWRERPADNKMIENIFMCFDRDMTILDIAQRYGYDYWRVWEIAERFERVGLIERNINAIRN